MAKSLAEIEKQFEELKEGKRRTVVLDPQTFWDRLTTALVVVVAYFSLNLISRWLSSKEPVELVGLGAVLLVGLALISFNESWVLDFQQRRLELYRSLFGIRWRQAAYDFSELQQIGVGGRRRDPKGRSHYWQYGIFVASPSRLLELFPALDTNYKAVVDLTHFLSQELNVPMEEPRPFGRLAYSKEKGGLEYTSGVDVASTKDRREANIHGRLTPLLASPPRQLPTEEMRVSGARRLEFEKKQSPATQRGCAVIGLLFVVPWCMTLPGLMFASGLGSKLVGLLLTVPALAVAYYLVDWLLFPITRRYEFVDGNARQVGIVDVRGGGKTKVVPFDVPLGAKVVNLEKVGSDELHHRIAIYEGETMLFLLDAAHTSQATKEKAEQIAASLRIPLETHSDLEPGADRTQGAAR